MDPFDVAFIKAAVSVVIVAATTFAFYGLRLRYRLAERQSLAASQDQQLIESDRAALEARIVELEERLDFAERRLIRDREPSRPDHPVPTPV